MLNIDDVAFALVVVFAIVVAVDFVILMYDDDNVVINIDDVIVIIVVILVIVTVADSVTVVVCVYFQKKFQFLFKNILVCKKFQKLCSIQLSGKKSKKKFARHKIRSDSPDKDVFAFDLEDPGETQVRFYEKLN